MSEVKLKAKDYISSLKPIWCPGCGDYGVLNAVAQAFAELGRPTEEIAVISGIGCSSRLPGYLSTYGFNGIHGRAVPIAAGLKIARPELLVVAVGGDGDGFSIGGNHLPHVIRRNVDLAYFVMDNSIYALTKGQLSPTTPLGMRTSTTAYGSIDDPIRPLHLTLAYGASFVAQSTPVDPKHLVQMMVKAIRHKGFAFVNILSPCITYSGKDSYRQIRERAFYVDQVSGYDPTDASGAWDIISEPDRYPVGIIFDKPRDTYAERIETIKKKASMGGRATLTGVRRQFLP